ncbi:MAG: RidA family protein [bacterium]|jgi:enamine deaminase RidA (YjgF/YER057c/UK114 family)|nr:RidA family protein [bacterium]
MTIEEKIKEMGIDLPTPPQPVGSYIPVVQTGNLCFVSGQLPIKDGRLTAVGSVPNTCSIEDAREGAKLCVINILAQLKAHLGSLDRIKRFVRLNGFVQSDIGFIKQPDVLNGASDFIVEILGDKGRHTRTAIGASELPINATVELDAIVEVE